MMYVSSLVSNGLKLKFPEDMLTKKHPTILRQQSWTDQANTSRMHTQLLLPYPFQTTGNQDSKTLIQIGFGGFFLAHKCFM